MPDSIYHQNIYLHKDYVMSIHDRAEKPDNELLFINYPNPFNATTTFKIKWPSDVPNTEKRIFIFDVTGRIINMIDLDNQNSITWDGRDQQGRVLASGTYFYKLVADQQVYKSGSITLLK